MRLLTRIMARQGYQTVQALGGEAALQALRRQSPDCILLDLAMPGVTGLQVLREVRSARAHQRTKVIVVTARPHLVPEAEAYGVDRVLVKPVGVNELIRAVEALIH